MDAVAAIVKIEGWNSGFGVLCVCLCDECAIQECAIQDVWALWSEEGRMGMGAHAAALCNAEKLWARRVNALQCSSDLTGFVVFSRQLTCVPCKGSVEGPGSSEDGAGWWGVLQDVQ